MFQLEIMALILVLIVPVALVALQMAVEIGNNNHHVVDILIALPRLDSYAKYRALANNFAKQTENIIFITTCNHVRKYNAYFAWRYHQK